MNPTRLRTKKSSHSLLAVIVLLVWVALLGATYVNRQSVFDWWRLRNYQAPTGVAQLATDDSMTDFARHIFYVNEPHLETKASFTQCNTHSEQTIVLGCYHGGQNGIYVLTVSDPRLNGVQQVTSAHEMLHAAYDRLSARDKLSVNTMLQNYYDNDLHDPRILDTIAAYKVSEPNDVVNEMHSIFGTEVANLPPNLEQYYARYFNNRSKVTSYAEQYQGEFTTRQNAIKDDDAKLATLKAQINEHEASLKNRQTQLTAQSAQLQSLRSSGDIAAYNAGVPAYNARVDAFNAEVATIKSLVTQYNDLVGTRNAIATETQQLTNEITSQATTIGR